MSCSCRLWDVRRCSPCVVRRHTTARRPAASPAQNQHAVQNRLYVLPSVLAERVGSAPPHLEQPPRRAYELAKGGELAAKTVLKPSIRIRPLSSAGVAGGSYSPHMPCDTSALWDWVWPTGSGASASGFESVPPAEHTRDARRTSGSTSCSPATAAASSSRCRRTARTGASCTASRAGTCAVRGLGGREVHRRATRYKIACT